MENDYLTTPERLIRLKDLASISDILEIVEKSRPSKENISYKTESNLKNASRKDLINISKEIEKEMHLAADLLEFEVAARLRDKLKEIKKEMMEIPE